MSNLIIKNEKKQKERYDVIIENFKNSQLKENATKFTQIKNFGNYSRDEFTAYKEAVSDYHKSLYYTEFCTILDKYLKTILEYLATPDKTIQYIIESNIHEVVKMETATNVRQSLNEETREKIKDLEEQIETYTENIAKAKNNDLIELYENKIDSFKNEIKELRNGANYNQAYIKQVSDVTFRKSLEFIIASVALDNKECIKSFTTVAVKNFNNKFRKYKNQALKYNVSVEEIEKYRTNKDIDGLKEVVKTARKKANKTVKCMKKVPKIAN